MVDARRSPSFSFEPRQTASIVRDAGGDDLKGDGSTQLSILSPVYGGKATGTYGLQDVVAANSLSCHPLPQEDRFREVGQAHKR